ncbi:MAG TPA: nickel pincer cofactor biosynthesis protein LarB [Herpetosiphonaceae bacterium]|nr:nickel pincer cofactor biosynthesis protein LarB [Herpetosiphonaceae bacterium]
MSDSRIGSPHETLDRLAQAISDGPDGHIEDYARVDLHRAARKGVPEVILAERKTPDQTVAIAQRMLESTGRAIISRVPPPTVVALETAFGEGISWERGTANRTIVLRRAGFRPLQDQGVVGIISAGTSDLPAAEEAAAICREMGCAVEMITDVGVAGLHRLFHPLKHLLDLPADVLIVAAGMDGALPSVVTGLVDVPVIGLPTSVGYGMGGNGEAALLTMLQSCAPGLAVVNIDNGVGAGAMAGMIAVRAERARRESSR